MLETLALLGPTVGSAAIMTLEKPKVKINNANALIKRYIELQI
jgi:hypothetical protein